MNVWIRVSSKMRIGTDIDDGTATRLQIDAGLDVTVYAAKRYAEEAQKEVGGIILEVSAACLADVEGEFGNEVCLSRGTEYEGSQPSSAYISVCYDGLDSKLVPNYGPFEPGTVEPQGEIATFGPEAQAWLKELEDQTGFELHQ